MRFVWAVFALAGCGRFGFAREGPPPDGTLEATCWARWRAGNVDVTAPQRVAELASTHPQSNPSLSDDGLTLYFERDDATDDLYVTHRDSRDAPWGAVTRLDALTSAAREGRMTTSADGMFAVFTSSRSGNTDLWTATNEPGSPLANPSTTAVGSLNTSASSSIPSTADGSGCITRRTTARPKICRAPRRRRIAVRGSACARRAPAIERGRRSDAVLDELVIAFSSGDTMAENQRSMRLRESRRRVRDAGRADRAEQPWRQRQRHRVRATDAGVLTSDRVAELYVDTPSPNRRANSHRQSRERIMHTRSGCYRSVTGSTRGPCYRVST
jgi:hypothetical protein